MTDATREAAPLEIVMGHDGKGSGLKIRSAAELVDVERVVGNQLRARLLTWRRVVVMTTAPGGSRRTFVLEPAEEEGDVRHGPFFVHGRFSIVEKANARADADRLWKEADVT